MLFLLPNPPRHSLPPHHSNPYSFFSHILKNVRSLGTSGLDLSRLCETCHISLSSYVHQYYCAYNLYFPSDLSPNCPLKPFYLFSSEFPVPWEERFDGEILLRTECFKDTHLLHIVQL